MNGFTPGRMGAKEIARTGLAEHALHLQQKQGKQPVICNGSSAFISYDRLCAQLEGRGSTGLGGQRK